MSKRNQKSATVPRHARDVVDASISLAMIESAINLVNEYFKKQVGYLNLRLS